MTAYFAQICCVMIMRPDVPGTDRYPVRRTRALWPCSWFGRERNGERRSIENVRNFFWMWFLTVGKQVESRAPWSIHTTEGARWDWWWLIGCTYKVVARTLKEPTLLKLKLLHACKSMLNHFKCVSRSPFLLYLIISDYILAYNYTSATLCRALKWTHHIILGLFWCKMHKKSGIHSGVSPRFIRQIHHLTFCMLQVYMESRCCMLPLG